MFPIPLVENRMNDIYGIKDFINIKRNSLNRTVFEHRPIQATDLPSTSQLALVS